MHRRFTFCKHCSVALFLFSVFVAPTRAQVDQPDPCADHVAHMSPRQHEHSRLYSDHTTGKDLCALAKDAKEKDSKEDVEVHVIVIREHAFPGPEVPPPPRYPHPYLVSAARGADAVILGVMKSKASAITRDRGFVFTDFQMNIVEVIKDNAKAPVGIGSDITVTRPGGTLEILGKKVRASDDSFKPFQLGGQYVLFLEYIPATGAYRAYAEQSFQLLPNGMAKLTTNQAINLAESRGDAQRFLNEVRAAVMLLR